VDNSGDNVHNSLFRKIFFLLKPSVSRIEKAKLRIASIDKSSSSCTAPEAKDAMNRFKMEAASDVGVAPTY
jgi:hypothetical protein